MSTLLLSTLLLAVTAASRHPPTLTLSPRHVNSLTVYTFTGSHSSLTPPTCTHPVTKICQLSYCLHFYWQSQQPHVTHIHSPCHQDMSTLLLSTLLLAVTAASRHPPALTVSPRHVNSLTVYTFTGSHSSLTSPIYTHPVTKTCELSYCLHFYWQSQQPHVTHLHSPCHQDMSTLLLSTLLLAVTAASRHPPALTLSPRYVNSLTVYTFTGSHSSLTSPTCTHPVTKICQLSYCLHFYWLSQQPHVTHLHSPCHQDMSTLILSTLLLAVTAASRHPPALTLSPRYVNSLIVYTFTGSHSSLTPPTCTHPVTKICQLSYCLHFYWQSQQPHATHLHSPCHRDMSTLLLSTLLLAVTAASRHPPALTLSPRYVNSLTVYTFTGSHSSLTSPTCTHPVTKICQLSYCLHFYLQSQQPHATHLHSPCHQDMSTLLLSTLLLEVTAASRHPPALTLSPRYVNSLTVYTFTGSHSSLTPPTCTHPVTEICQLFYCLHFYWQSQQPHVTHLHSPCHQDMSTLLLSTLLLAVTAASRHPPALTLSPRYVNSLTVYTFTGSHSSLPSPTYTHPVTKICQLSYCLHFYLQSQQPHVTHLHSPCHQDMSTLLLSTLLLAVTAASRHPPALTLSPRYVNSLTLSSSFFFSSFPYFPSTISFTFHASYSLAVLNIRSTSTFTPAHLLWIHLPLCTHKDFLHSTPKSHVTHD